MTKTVSVPVPGGLMAHGEVLKAVVLREPTMDEYFEFGDPVVWTQAPDGSVFAVENGGAIKNYLAKCLVQPKDPLLLEAAGFRVAREVKKAILGFFRDVDGETEPSKTSATTSSSTSDGAPTDSAA